MEIADGPVGNTASYHKEVIVNKGTVVVDFGHVEEKDNIRDNVAIDFN